MIAALLLLTLSQAPAPDPAGDAPPAPLTDGAPPRADAAPAPIAPEAQASPKRPAPDAPKKNAPAAGGPNKLLAAGVAAGVTCLAAPSIWCCSSGILCAWIPCLVTPALAAGGAGAGILASGATFDPLTIGAAAGVGAGGALVAAAIGVPLWIIGSGVSATQTPTNPGAAQSVNLGIFAVWTGIAAVLSLGTAAGVGAAVYFLMPDEAAPGAERKGSKDAVEARAGPPAGRARVAMAY